MRSEEFISLLSERSEVSGNFEELRKGLPLGLDMSGEVVLSQKREKPFTVRHTCVTGAGRTAFIRRLLVNTSCLYEKSDACFFVISPKTEYGELLRLRSIDLTVPYIRTKADFTQALGTVKELLHMREQGRGYPRLFLVLDGIEELEDCNRNGDLEEYRAVFETLSRRDDVDIISGAELMKSIFSGYPGAFVGVGNCLVTTREEGKADVTYVGDDVALSMPVPMRYPSEPSIIETIIFLNSIPKTAENE